MQKLFTNKVLVAALLAWFCAQGIKFLRLLIRKGKTDFTLFVSSGGMPSAHTAMVAATATTVGRLLGWDSPVFALAVIVALIVMYDAAGLRRAAGKQAQVLNQLVDDLYHQRRGKTQEGLKELIGHTPVEVLAGALLGVAVGLLL